MNKFMKSLLKRLGQIQCAKVSQCSSWNQGFLIYILGGNCVPSPTPFSPDKAIYAILIKCPLNKGKRWHSTADQQTLGLRGLCCPSSQNLI